MKNRLIAGNPLGYLAALSLIFSCSQAIGQYPTKPLRILVGFSAGGPMDVIARAVGQRLTGYLQQPVVIENRPGVDGSISFEAVARAAPDGHTLLLGASGLAINVSLYKNSPFDPVKDFAPISAIGSAPNILVVHPSVPARSLQEFLSFANANKGKVFYASTSSPTYLATELLNTMTGIKMISVPYKGAGAAIPAMLSGELHFMLSSIGTLLPQVKAGKLRALAVTSEMRTALAPGVPTVSETGVPGYSARTWYGLLAPAGTARGIVDRLNAETHRALSDAEVKGTLFAQGIEPTPTTPEEFGAFIQQEVLKWQKVIRESGAQVN